MPASTIIIQRKMFIVVFFQLNKALQDKFTPEIKNKSVGLHKNLSFISDGGIMHFSDLPKILYLDFEIRS